MIPFRLKRENDRCESERKYGVILANTLYANYPVTIVDNYEEVVDGRYTGKPTLCLLHLSEDVREYVRLELFSEFLYMNVSRQKPTYKMYDYTKKELADTEIVRILHRVLYGLQPDLQMHSLVGWTSGLLEDDPNYYEGSYVLNDEETYTILKCRNQYRFYKGEKSYYPHWKREEPYLFQGELDFDLYKLALDVHRKRQRIITKTNELLDNGKDELIGDYRALSEKLNEILQDRF